MPLSDAVQLTCAWLMFSDSSVSSFSGRVAEIDLRYTTLEADGKKVFVPNAMVFSNAVTVTAA